MPEVNKPSAWRNHYSHEGSRYPIEPAPSKPSATGVFLEEVALNYAPIVPVDALDRHDREIEALNAEDERHFSIQQIAPSSAWADLDESPRLGFMTGYDTEGRQTLSHDPLEVDTLYRAEFHFVGVKRRTFLYGNR